MALTTAQMKAQLEQMRPHLEKSVTDTLDTLEGMPEAIQGNIITALYSMAGAVKEQMENKKKKEEDVEEKVKVAWEAWIKKGAAISQRWRSVCIWTQRRR